jgi:predicted nucleotidyltransferase/uncharacterized protein (UPF0332 family)
MAEKKEKKEVEKQKPKQKLDKKNFPTLNLMSEHDIAMDFAVKAYKKFDKLIKSIILFGSTVKKKIESGSDIDIVVLLDDASIKWDQELIAWYREELDKLMRLNPYQGNLHINTIKITSWWEDLMKGDPLVLNIIRNGESLVDFGGFFEPLKYLLVAGKIKATPEAVYNCLQRAPFHLQRSKFNVLGALEGAYWCMVDAAHAALIAYQINPPSPEHIPINLKENFVDKGKLKIKYVVWFRDLHFLQKQITHGQIKELKGVDIDAWQQRAEEFLNTMAKLVNDVVY